MNKFLNYVSIALLTLTLFSCAKNEWTPEVEAEFKKTAKEEMVNSTDSPMTEMEATLMIDCMTDKLKKQNILPHDVENSENEAKLENIAMECAKETLTK